MILSVLHVAKVVLLRQSTSRVGAAHHHSALISIDDTHDFMAVHVNRVLTYMQPSRVADS